MNGKKALSLMMVLGLVASLMLLFVPATSAWAATGDNKTSKSQREGGSNKILIANVPPGESVITYVGDAAIVAPNGTTVPFGNFAARIDQAPGGMVETFGPVGKVTTVYIVNQESNAYRLIGIVSPTSAWPDTTLDARSTLQLAQNQPFAGQGLASPATGNAAPPSAQPQLAQPKSSILPQMRMQPVSQKSLSQGMGSFAGSTKNFTQRYTVVAGDTLSALAKKFGTTVAALVAGNGLSDPNSIRPGQTLMTPPLQ